MGRPRIINPTGTTKKVSVVLSAPIAQEIEREAKRRGVSAGTVLRERLVRERGAK